LRAYVAKVRVPSHPSRGIAAPPSIYGHDCPQEYPIGEIMWDYSPLASPDWEFPIFSSNNGGTPSSSSQKKSVISNVQWAFDMREMVSKNRVSHHQVSTEQPPLRSTVEEDDDDDEKEGGAGGGGGDSTVLRALEQEVGTPTKEIPHVATIANAEVRLDAVVGLDAGIEEDPSAAADRTMIDDAVSMKDKEKDGEGVFTDESKALAVEQIAGAEEEYEAIFEDDI